MRVFESGATRDSDTNKLDFEGFLNPIVFNRFAEYMREHRIQSDGKIRDSDNWQKGIPPKVCLKSLLRHTWDVWMMFRSGREVSTKELDKMLEDSLCAILFNTQAILLEQLTDREYVPDSIKSKEEMGKDSTLCRDSDKSPSSLREEAGDDALQYTRNILEPVPSRVYGISF